MRWTSSFDSARREQWQRGTAEVDGPEREASSLLWLNTVRVGLTPSLEAEIALPIAWMDAEDDGGRVERTSVGDVPTTITWTQLFEAWSLGATVGAYWPVGELGTEGLPSTATFSTGTVDPIVGAHAVGPAWLGFGLQLSTRARLVFFDGDDGTRTGSTISTSLGIDRTLSRRVAAQLLLTHFHRNEDSGEVMEDSGGDWLYLQPQVVATLFAHRDQTMQIMVGARIPLRQDVVGRQLVDEPALSFGLGYTRNF